MRVYVSEKEIESVWMVFKKKKRHSDSFALSSDLRACLFLFVHHIHRPPNKCVDTMTFCALPSTYVHNFIGCHCCCCCGFFFYFFRFCYRLFSPKRLIVIYLNKYLRKKKWYSCRMRSAFFSQFYKNCARSRFTRMPLNWFIFKHEHILWTQFFDRCLYN